MVLVGLPGTASAHSGKQSYVYFSIFDHEVEGRVEIPVVDLEGATGIEVPRRPGAARAVVRENLDALQQYAADHLRVADADTGEEWDLRFEGFSILPVAGTYVQLPFTVEERFDDAPPRQFQVTYDGIIESNPEKDAVVLVETDWRAATFNEEANELFFYSVGRTDQTVVLESASTAESMLGVRGLGTDAFRTGAPNLLLVVALMLPVGLLARRGGVRSPAPTVSGAVRRVGIVLGVLAISHSITLWLTGLGAIGVSESTARALVEMSLLAAAAWVVLLAVGPNLVRLERAIVAALGVVQGLGLGWTFRNFDLDRSRPILSAIAFNIGVEVGVAVLAALVFPTLLLLRRTVLAPVVLYGGALVVGLYGLGWLAQRAGSGDPFMPDVANPLRVWPRNGVYLLVVMAASAGLYWWTSTRRRLRPVEGGPTDQVEPAREEPAEAVPS